MKEELRKDVVKIIKEAYDKGYHEGFEDACDIIPTYLTESTGSLISELKEAARKAKCEVFDTEAEQEELIIKIDEDGGEQ